MSNHKTIARPYAKAVFEHALIVNQLESWSKMLGSLAVIVSDSALVRFINNPATLPSQHAQLISQVMDIQANSEDETGLKNFIKTLAFNKRLLVLPDIYELFQA